MRLSCTQHDVVVPVSHHAIFYGEPKLHSMCKYCGKYWSSVLSDLVLINAALIRRQMIGDCAVRKLYADF